MKTIAQKKSAENYKQRSNVASFNSISQPTFSSSFPNNNLLIKRKPICPCGGGCPRCKDSLPIQTKLKIGQPNDKYEQEADRVSEQVLRMPEPSVQRKPG